jgi:hypothetical protein
MSTDENRFQKVEWTGDQWEPSDDDDEHGMPLRPRNAAISEGDLELLKLAAKAIGADRVDEVEGEEWLNLHFADGSTLWNWNPLVYKDNAFDLLVKLGLHLDFAMGMVVAYAGRRYEKQCIERLEQDESAATCRAVTRAAAEIAVAQAKKQA